MASSPYGAMASALGSNAKNQALKGWSSVANRPPQMGKLGTAFGGMRTDIRTPQASAMGQAKSNLNSAIQRRLMNPQTAMVKKRHSRKISRGVSGVGGVGATTGDGPGSKINPY